MRTIIDPPTTSNSAGVFSIMDKDGQVICKLRAAVYFAATRNGLSRRRRSASYSGEGTSNGDCNSCSKTSNERCRQTASYVRFPESVTFL